MFNIRLLTPKCRGDPSLEKYFKNDLVVRQQYMLILMEYFNKHIKGNRNPKIPKEVIDATKEYLDDNNVILHSEISRCYMCGNR